jgi:nicotinamide-nucleotide amidase
MGCVNTSNRALRTAGIIAVGSELLGTTRVDTNSLYLAGRLESLGIELRAKSVVGDQREELSRVFRESLNRADVVIVTGGLGPTDDDVTREAVTDALGLEMIEDPSIVATIAARFASRGLKMPAVNRKQAMVPRNATVLQNANGTAPGLLLQHDGKIVALLPGPPRELRAIFEAQVEPVLRANAGQASLYRASVFVGGRGESHVEEIAQPIYSKWRTGPLPIETTILATPGQIELHLCLRSEDVGAATRRLVEARDQLASALGRDVFSTDGRAMEEIVGDLLRQRKLTISAAESCTGGLFMSRLTDVPGSSAWVLGGIVAYSDQTKTLFADVDPALIKQHGAVSESVAVALAEGIRARTGSSLGVGITGIAGPSGGTPNKPVGTVAIAVVGPDGPARVRTAWHFGGRTQIKFNATQTALDMVRRSLI